MKSLSPKILSPYRVPVDNFYYVVNFSGGSSSGFMLYKILEQHSGKVPDNAEVVFCNTGKEREETLEFVQKCAEKWNIPITWLEYDFNPNARGGREDPKSGYKVVDFKTASRRGEPYEKMVEGGGHFPNPVRRICTAELKIKTTQRYMYRKYYVRADQTCNILGIRADEQGRHVKMQEAKVRGPRIFPMVYASHGAKEVESFWSQQNFRLPISSLEGNCDFCFLKSKYKLMYLAQQNPKEIDWWVEMESKNRQRHPAKKEQHCQFRQEYSFAELREAALSMTQEERKALKAKVLDESLDIEDCYCTS